LNCICILAGVGAAWKVADVEKGATVAIFGLGAVGLAVSLEDSFRLDIDDCSIYSLNCSSFLKSDY